MPEGLTFHPRAFALMWGEPEGCLRLQTVDEALDIREPRVYRDFWLWSFYETWIYAFCPRRPVWYRDDPYQLVAAQLLSDYYDFFARKVDVLYGWSHTA